MLSNQRDLFNLGDEMVYVNHAYMSPQLNSITAIGLENLRRKERPYHISQEDFFVEKEILRARFAKLISAPDSKSVAIIPSVSFGIATAMKNIPFDKNDQILVLEEQFPSNFYTWKELETSHGVQVKTIKAPKVTEGRAKKWNQAILEGINEKTKVIAMPHVHWADGTKFDLTAIRERANDFQSYLVIDGTQSVGAMPFSVLEIKPDALICGGYKWLMGPYSLGVAYFGERFDHGIPLDNNWMNHEQSEDFAKLVHYNQNFKPKALRYDVGESSNFVLTPMLSEGIRQLLEWTPEGIQEYCKKLTSNPIASLREQGYFIEDAAYRGHHLFGIHLDTEEALQNVKNKLLAHKIHVSYRGTSIRVSPHLYTTKHDIQKLITCLCS